MTRLISRRDHTAMGRNAYGKEKSTHELLGEIADYLSTTGPSIPLFVDGLSGSGNEALMARAAADARVAYPGAVAIQRFIRTPVCRFERQELLEGMCQHIGRAFGGIETAIGNYPKLKAELPKYLALATPDRPLLFFLGTLDEDRWYQGWLPRSLPPNVRVVVWMEEEDNFQCFRLHVVGGRVIVC